MASAGDSGGGRRRSGGVAMSASELLSPSTWWTPTTWWCVSNGSMLGHLSRSVASIDAGAVERRVNEARGGSQTCITDAGDSHRRPLPAVEGWPC